MNIKIKKILETINQNQINLNYSGLINGQCGIALFYYYCSLLLNVNNKKKCLNSVNDALIIINSGNRINTFCSGISGFAWLLEFLKEKELYNDEDILLLDELDKYLYTNMIYDVNNNNYDYLHGAIGYGLYFLKRLHKPKTIEYLSDLVNNLKKISINNIIDKSIKWESIVNYEKGIKGLNISLSHGMASVIVILTKIYNVSIEKKLCNDLITGAIAYILKQEIDRNKYNSYFPSLSIESDRNIVGSRLAWCYGDLGVAMAIWQAGQALNREDWITKSLEVLLYAANERRDLNKNMVIDAGLCHGTAGIGHIFYRMYWNTKIPEFKIAADYWFNETIKMAYHEDGLAGFKAWHTEKHGWVNEVSLLEGISGIGLALMSYYYEIEPSWDECLLLS